MPGVDRSASQGSHIHHCFLCMSCYNSKLFTWYKATILPFSKFNIFDISRSRFTKSPFHTNFIKLFFQQKPLSRLLDQGSRAPKSTFHTICTPPRVFLAFTRGRVKWRLVAPRLSQFLSTKKYIWVLFHVLKHFHKKSLPSELFSDCNLKTITCEENLKPFSFWKKERMIACPAVNASSTKCISKSPPSLTALSLSQWELITFS